VGKISGSPRDRPDRAGGGEWRDAPREEHRLTSTASARGALLWCRAAALALVTLLAGTLAHLGAAGLLPPPLAMAALLGGGTVLAAPFLRAEASAPRLVLLLVLGQALVHTVLTALAGHHQEAAGHLGRAGHSHRAGGPEWLEHLTSDLSGTHALMAVAHAAAAAVVGLWLARGERALWSLLRHVGHALLPRVRRVTGPTPVGRARVVPAPAVRRPAGLLALTTELRRRGPPAVPAR
jgi:hypothetical protein